MKYITKVKYSYHAKYKSNKIGRNLNFRDAKTFVCVYLNCELFDYFFMREREKEGEREREREREREIHTCINKQVIFKIANGTHSLSPSSKVYEDATASRLPSWLNASEAMLVG